MWKLLWQQRRFMAQATLLEWPRIRVRQCSETANAVAPKAEQNLIDATQLINQWHARLNDAGVGSVSFNLKCFTAHVLKKRFETLNDIQSVSFTKEQCKEFERMCSERCSRKPLQHILGEWNFMGLPLKMAHKVFIPRPETEEFVAKVIDEYRSKSGNLKMLEIGCGTGAISLAILHALPNVKIDAIECNTTATKLSVENAKLLNLSDRFNVYNHFMSRHNYLPEKLKKSTYDVIISNPPYVKTSEYNQLQPEVKFHESVHALDGGADGLDVARLIFELATMHLRRSGTLWLELASDQIPLVQTVLKRQFTPLRFIASFEDRHKQPRFIQIQKT